MCKSAHVFTSAEELGTHVATCNGIPASNSHCNNSNNNNNSHNNSNNSNYNSNNSNYNSSNSGNNAATIASSSHLNATGSMQALESEKHTYFFLL